MNKIKTKNQKREPEAQTQKPKNSIVSLLSLFLVACPLLLFAFYGYLLTDRASRLEACPITAVDWVGGSTQTCNGRHA